MYLDRMKKARKLIAEIPDKKLRMSTWIEVDYLPDGAIPSVQVLKQEGCGTVGCIAGWVNICFVDRQSESKSRENAKEYLGLTEREADALFYLTLPNFLLQFNKTGLPDKLKRFDKQKPAKRKEKILEIFDYIIEYGFTWLPDYDRSTVVRQFGH